jgi:hypothetical protein
MYEPLGIIDKANNISEEERKDEQRFGGSAELCAD